MFLVFFSLFMGLVASVMDDRYGQKKVVQFVEKGGKKAEDFLQRKGLAAFPN